MSELLAEPRTDASVQRSPHGLKSIWLVADDYGISPAVNAAIRDLLQQARINATSVIVVAPSFDAAEAKALAALRSRGRRLPSACT
jgi:hypothetical protein